MRELLNLSELYLGIVMLLSQKLHWNKDHKQKFSYGARTSKSVTLLNYFLSCLECKHFDLSFFILNFILKFYLAYNFKFNKIVPDVNMLCIFKKIINSIIKFNVP